MKLKKKKEICENAPKKIMQEAVDSTKSSKNAFSIGQALFPEVMALE